jgi:hypothetical protein
MREKRLGARVERLARQRLVRRQQAIVGKQSLFPILVLRLADDVGEYAEIIVDVAVVDIVGRLLLMDQRLEVEISPLPQQEGAERKQAA